MNVIASKITTPDGTTLQSFSRHDFKSHKDTVDGNTYGIDGGTIYQRIIGPIDKLKVLLVTDEDDFNLIRKEMYWGSYGKKGLNKFKWVYLHEMSNDHIQAILDTQKHVPEWRRELFQKELEFRKEHNITIKDK